MTSVPTGKFRIVTALAACVLTLAATVIDRRVVDVAEAGHSHSEATHGYAGHDAFSGFADDKSFRQARGWMRYALTTFDDTEVTIAFTFVGRDTVPRSYEVVVEDSLIATRTLAANTGSPVVVELLVPFAVTRGKTNIAVTMRGSGGPTPMLHELRIIQDHNEVDHQGVNHAAASPSPSLKFLPGVVR